MFPNEVTVQNIEEQNADVSTIDIGQGLKFNSNGYPVEGTGENSAWYTNGKSKLYLQSGDYDFTELGSMNIRCTVYFSTGTDNTVTFDGGNCNFTQYTRINQISNVVIKGGTFTGLNVYYDDYKAKTYVTIEGGTFNSYGSNSMVVNGRSPIVTVKGGVFNALVEVTSDAKLIIPHDSSAQFPGGITSYSRGTVTSEALIITSDGYPLGSNGGETACSYTDGNNLGWEYVPATNATESDSKGTLYLSDASITLNDSTAVNCDIVMGKTFSGTDYINYRNSTPPTLNGGTYNGTVSGLVTIKNGTFKNTVTAETYTSVISNGTFEKDVTLGYDGKITGGTFKDTVALNSGGEITGGIFMNTVMLLGGGTITGGTFTNTVMLPGGGTISGGVFRGYLSGNSQVRITGGLFLRDLGQLDHTSTGGYFADQSTLHLNNGYSCGEICFVDNGGTFTLPKFQNEKLNYIYVVWENSKADSTTFTITPSKKITSVNLDADRTGEADAEFTLAPSDFKEGNNSAYLTTNELYKVTLPENIHLDVAVPVQSSGGTVLGMAEIGQDHTITLPEGATIRFKDDNGTDAAFVAGSSNSPLQKDGNDYLYTVPGSESTVKRLNKLHIGADGLPITTGTYSERSAGGDITYYGDGWTYSADGTLTITGNQTLTDETNAITAPTIIKANVTGGTFDGSVSNSGSTLLTNAVLKGTVSASGIVKNCQINLTGPDTLTISSDGVLLNSTVTVSSSTAPGGISILNNWSIYTGNTIDLGGTILQNNRTIQLGGKDSVIKNGTIRNNGKLISCDSVVEADVENNGQIEDSILTGKVTNGANGTITRSILYGELENAPANVHKLTVTPAESVTVAPQAYDVAPAFNGTAYVTEGLDITVTTSIQSPIWTAESGITLDEDQLTARTLTLTMPGSDAALTVAKKPGDFDPSDFIVTAPENAVEDGSTVYEVVAVKRPDCEKAYGKISVIYRDAEKNIVSAPSAAGVYTYTVIVADTAEFAGGTVATGSFEIAPAIDPGPAPSGDGDAGTGIALVMGGAAIGGAAYLIGTQIWLETNLPGGVIPTSRQQLADLLWLTAGKPEPQSSVLFTDISAEAVDSQKAARWCVEQGLLSDKGEAFQPSDYVFRPQVIKAWNDVQALLTTAQ